MDDDLRIRRSIDENEKDDRLRIEKVPSRWMGVDIQLPSFVQARRAPVTTRIYLRTKKRI